MPIITSRTLQLMYGGLSGSPPPSSDKCDSNLPISSVTASGSQSENPASGATDNDQNTRWSNQGFGSWIRLDLGGVKKICSLDIAWYRGNERTNTFEIATSSDGSTFTTIGSEKSKGTSSALEKYDISDSYNASRIRTYSHLHNA